MNLFLFGKQGSGKGTQARLFCEKEGYIVFDAGQALREIAKEPTELGRTVHDIVNVQGNLVNNEITMRVVSSWLAARPQHFGKIIFDGIPRFEEQRQLLEAVLAQHNMPFLAVHIHIPLEVAFQRITHRRVCEDCKFSPFVDYTGRLCPRCGGRLLVREDDMRPEIVAQRIGNYQTLTRPVVRYYHDHDALIEVDGLKSSEAIFADILSQIQQKQPYTAHLQETVNTL